MRGSTNEGTLVSRGREGRGGEELELVSPLALYPCGDCEGKGEGREGGGEGEGGV